MHILKFNSVKTWGAAALLSASLIAGLAYADTLRRSAYNPHFTVEGQGATVSFNWYVPVPAAVEISRYTGSYVKAANTVVYDGPPPATLSLTGGGRTGGGRYTIKAKNAMGTTISYTVDVVGPANVKNW